MKGYMGRTAGLLAMAGALGAMPTFKLSAKDRRIENDRRKISYNPPRSMTPAEKEYYAVHKNLHHFREVV